MTELFFAVGPVWWIGSLHLSSLAVALSAGILVCAGLWYRGRPRLTVPIQRTPSYQYHPIDPDRDNYAEMTLIEIRRYLTYTYRGEHSWAHIPERIAEYSTDKELLSIIEQLQRAEYGTIGLSSDEKEHIQRELALKMK